jgi:predicted small metal-binding protein
MKSFQCKDVGFDQCNWRTQGDDETVMMRDISKHGREQHGLTEIKEDLDTKIRSAFRDVKAA